MVVHFRKLNAHKFSVLELYRVLLRHVSRIEREARVPLRSSREIFKLTKREFKLQKKQMSYAITKERLDIGYKLENDLEGLTEGTLTISDILTFIKDSMTKSNKRKQLKNVLGQPMKRDLDNQQDLETQRITNYINRYIREKQNNGELPQVIDPKIRNTIIKDEALHARAHMDIERSFKRIAKGPYQVHIARSSNVSFVRTPWEQSRKISPLILNHVKHEQTLIDMLQSYEKDKYLYEMENAWERELGNHQEADWGEFLKSLSAQMAKQSQQRKAYFDTYSKTNLPSILQKNQEKVDKWYLFRRSKFEELVTRTKGVTPFDYLLKRPTLRDLVKEYKFDSS